MNDAASFWQCPLCGKPLTRAASALRCPAGHSFDTAKEGYCNLLPVQAMRSKAPGDSKEMIAARRRLLESGTYRVFGEALAMLTLRYGSPCAAGEPLRVLDTGCGEGWYDRCLARAARQAGIPLSLAGFDISKPAVRLAAKALPEADYAVASSFHEPVKSGTADVLLNVFSPFAREEFLRVLRPGGLLIYAVPTPRHLFAMKQVLYDTPYENPVRDIPYEGFTPAGEYTAEDTVTVPAEHIEALFAMTPYYWKTPAEGAARLRALPRLTTEIGFRFLLMRKTEA